ncbi:hypothetical protein CC86DRAFT_465176 [Ophiobolus disseminans]|uniref:Uncharacterized protein n=1 Tax=Ophiobolus disseminans TaxID=1469910 RepID=A0A6A7A4V2_9PLEO|nr:hypothetical protein CC86DRAFT_465176 [Ophiobolus disseminans]
MKLITSAIILVIMLLVANPALAKDPKPSCSKCDFVGDSYCASGEISMVVVCRKDGDKLCWWNDRRCEGHGGCVGKQGSAKCKDE